jgi:Branched-chain amino acid aminotransferase/4-amino-4-deoxychorismate lyase
MRLGVSTWRRAADVALPARVKSSANYIGGRLARIEVHRLGYDDAVLLNDAGRVAEVTGACIVVADKGRIISPPTSEGCLDSITVAALEQVARELGLPFERRPIERSELLTADECGVAGTITELTLVAEVDGFRYEQDGMLSQLRQGYLAAMRGEWVLPGTELVTLIDRSDPAVPARAAVRAS